MGHNFNLYNREINLEFWDTAGQEKYQGLVKFFFKDCQMIFIFYDSSDKESFERSKTFFNIAKENTNDEKVVIVLVSNKYNLYVKSKENINKVSEEEALEYASKNNLLFAHISIVEKYDNGINIISLLIYKMIYYNELIDKALKEYFKRKLI